MLRNVSLNSGGNYLGFVRHNFIHKMTRGTFDTFDLPESEQASLSGIDSESIPMNDDDIWNMSVSASQNATMGIDWLKTIELLQTSTKSTVPPLTIAYNSAMSAAEKNSNVDLAIEILNDMKKQDKPVVDSITYKLLISNCVKCNRVNDAIEFYDEMIESGFTPDHGVVRNVLWLLSRHALGENALAMLDKLKSLSRICRNTDFITQNDYVYTIESCIKSQMFDEAIELYNEMKVLKDYNLTPEILTSMLFVCYNTSNLDMAMELYSTVMKIKTFDLTLTHYKLLISILLLSRKFEIIEHISNKIFDVNPLDYTLCQSIMQSYAQTGNFQRAFKLLEIMNENKLITNKPESFVACIKSCEQCGEWKLAMKILRMYQQSNNADSIEVYNSVLAVLAKCEEWENMISLYKELQPIDDIRNEESEKSSLKINGDTVAYILMAYYHMNEPSEINSLLHIPMADTPLLMKLRSVIKAN